MSIRRKIKLILDKAAAKKAEQAAKKSLDKGTDPKKAEKNLGRVKKSLGGLRSLALKLGAALGAAFVVRKIQQFGKEAVRVAAEAAAIWNRLAGQLRVAGVEFREVEGEITRTARALQDVTTLGDEDFAAVMTELLGTTNDYAASLAEVETVANLAAAKQIDMKTAAQLVGRAMVGQTGTLSRYGIIVEEGADAMEVLRARFDGMARNEARTLEGRLKQLNNEWADFKQAVGDAMIAAGGGTSVLETLIGTVKGMTIWVNENRQEIAFWGSVVIETFKAAGQTIVGIFNLVRHLFGVVAAEMVRITRQAQLEIAHVIDAIARGVNLAIEGLNKLPGIDIDFRMDGQPIEQFEAMRDAAAEDVERHLRGVTDALVQVGQGWLDVHAKATSAERAQRSAAAAAVPGTPSPSPTPSSEGDGGLSISGPTGPALPEGLGSFDPLAGVEEQLVTQTADIAENMRSVLRANDPFTELSDQAELTAAFMRDGFKGVGLAIVKDLIAGRAEEQFAAGMAALAAGTWPPNPAALAAAGKHFAAAAAFKAIAGSLSGGGGGRGGAVGGSAPRGALGTSVPGSRQINQSEVHIYIDPFDPDDSFHQRQVGRAAGLARERFGDQVPVKIHHGRSNA